jgi:hypothetical protein
MVEHVEHGVSAPSRARVEPRTRRIAGSVWSWSLDHALLFPIVAIFLGTIIASLPRELVSDSWFAIFGGHEIVHHGLPGPDNIAIWTHGRDWVDQQWLGQLIFYGLYAAGGVKLALLAHAAAVGSAFFLAIAFARWRGGSIRAICWIALPAIFLLVWGAWAARAQSLAFVLFVAVVWLLTADARDPSRRIYLTFPILLLWANIHGSAATGALLVTLAGLTYAFQQRKRPRRRWVRRATVLTVAPLLCLFASPYALSLPDYYHHVLLHPGFRDFIVEWRPTAPNLQTAPFYLLAFLAVWLIGKRSDRLLPFEQVLFAATILMGLQTMRMVVWFAFVALMLLPTSLDGVIRANTSAARFQLLNRALIWVSVAGVLTTLVAVSVRHDSWLARYYPAQALAAVQQAERAAPGAQVFANEQYSDWLLLKRPELRGRIAFDIRFELVSKQQLLQLVNARRQVEGWQATVAPYGIFVLKKGPDDLLANGLVRQHGARQLYRGHGLVVISRPVMKRAKGAPG